jgi:hypothetical protein
LIPREVVSKQSKQSINWRVLTTPQIKQADTVVSVPSPLAPKKHPAASPAQCRTGSIPQVTPAPHHANITNTNDISIDWQNRLRIPNYLSILSIALCTLLLLSFLILSPTHSHRHYLSIGLLIPVLLIALSFAIPISTTPQICFDAITPASMHTSMSCAWTGSLITLGGLGCVIWVFIRSLWLFLRIVYDIAPGRKFMLASIAAGTFLPIAFLVAVLTRTGFSYRMGATCLPNHENAVTTFWVWLLMFAVLGFGLQMATTGYCVLVYVRTLRTERSRMSWEGHGRRKEHQDDLETWGNLKKLFLLQWRNILVSVFVLAGSLVFFVVFWTQDKKLGKVSNDQANIRPVKTWILCQVLSKGDKKECRKYVKGFTMDEPVVLTALILASVSPVRYTSSVS